jgi:hypothetical protein
MGKALFIAALLTVAISAAPARAEPTAEALRLYSVGEFMAAANLAAAQNSPSDLVFVSRALLASCAISQAPQDVDATLARAAESAQLALSLDPSSVAARLNLALAYGMMGKRAALHVALSRDYAGRGRRLIDEALARAPNNAEAHALLGAWHFEVLRRGGGLGALAYGARLASGMAEFRRAQSLAPDDPFIPLQFALALLQRDTRVNAVLAAKLLTDSLSKPARDALEAAAQTTARRLQGALANGGFDAAHRLARATTI